MTTHRLISNFISRINRLIDRKAKADARRRWAAVRKAIGE